MISFVYKKVGQSVQILLDFMDSPSQTYMKWPLTFNSYFLGPQLIKPCHGHSMATIKNHTINGDTIIIAGCNIDNDDIYELFVNNTDSHMEWIKTEYQLQYGRSETVIMLISDDPITNCTYNDNKHK